MCSDGGINLLGDVSDANEMKISQLSKTRRVEMKISQLSKTRRGVGESSGHDAGRPKLKARLVAASTILC
jgi:hypothetical protein